MKARHVFGPVLSRRLGVSLGIDLVPFKTCTYDCVYCECGHTTDKTIVRRHFFHAEEVIAELDGVLATRPRLDSVTFAGSGEPTLARSLGPVIAFVKREFPEYTLSVLTNGSLLTDQEVRAELLPADRVIPTLTTAVQDTFERIHHPHPSLKVDEIISGIAGFSSMYPGALWLEVFIVPRLNTTEKELAGLKSAIDLIDPDCIQINTVDRPPSEGWVEAASQEQLERISKALGRPCAVIGGWRHPPVKVVPAQTGSADLIRSVLLRRPSTVEDLVRITGLNGGEIVKILGRLDRSGEVTHRRMTRGVFYVFRQKKDAGDKKR